MKKIVFLSYLLALFGFDTATAANVEYNTSAKLRALYGYTEPANAFKKTQNKNNFPLFGYLSQKISYQKSDTLSFNLHGSLTTQASNSIENLNQGHWGEEIYASVFSDVGDFYIGQMENAAAKLSVTNALLPVWQPLPVNITDFIENPNWRQKKRTKYYNTFTSTIPNTDGSSFKFLYITPEYYNTTLGFSYTPSVNSADSLISKFSSYHNKSAYSVAVYHRLETNSFDTDFYISMSDYKNSHTEYGTGISFYRKGLTVYASYLKSEVKNSDKPITKSNKSKNKQAYFDDFRKSTAYNLGISYEFAFLTSTLSYFNSYSQNTKARNRIINLHNSIKFDKKYTLYLGCGYTDFKKFNGNLGNKGFSAYTGVEFEL